MDNNTGRYYAQEVTHTHPHAHTHKHTHTHTHKEKENGRKESQHVSGVDPRTGHGQK
jgi:hypothetical protein